MPMPRDIAVGHYDFMDPCDTDGDFDGLFHALEKVYVRAGADRDLHIFVTSVAGGRLYRACQRDAGIVNVGEQLRFMEALILVSPAFSLDESYETGYNYGLYSFIPFPFKGAALVGLVMPEYKTLKSLRSEGDEGMTP